ncbi:MAG: DNA gyrase subunit A [Bacteriovoracaceae bacterium]|nr:DNA gyrase subunit A [Bacteriovoracaceae bacterium]
MDEIQTNLVKPLLIQEEMRSCYLDYAMSVIIGRALPDVRDGLKPVHRRVLFSQKDLNNVHNRPFLKSARVVGDVIGKYHPHGDAAVYGTIVRMAQEFSLRYPLVDGQGNFGSIDGDSAAAMRYTEIRMKKLTEEILSDLDKETVDWQPNYDDSLQEPLVLPTRVPNLLINGSSGIAVGMATNIPPHNLTEVMNALLKLITEPDTAIEELMRMIPGPDFPTYGTIHGIQGLRSAYLTGKGIIQIRAKAEIEVLEKGGRERIIITELPYQVNKAKLIERIAELVHEKQITGISDIKDESNRLGIRVVVDIKRGEMGSVILNQLYKHTQLQDSFGIIFLCIHQGQPKVMNLKQLLQAFIEHRREVVVRRTAFELKKAQEKAHILEGLKIAVENIDEVVELIKKAGGPQEAKSKLIEKYSLSEIQAQSILDMRLQRITGLERDKIIKEYAEIMAEIVRLKEILTSQELVDQIIHGEFTEILENYGDARRTQIVADMNELHMEDLIKEEEVIVTITQQGYIKRMTLDTYQSQGRGGKGVKGSASEEDDDFITEFFTANTHSTLLFFSNKGSVFNIKVYEIPEGTRTAKGRNIVNIISLPAGEKIQGVIPTPKEFDGHYLLIATEQGLIKRTELSEYKNVRQTGIRGMKLLEGDSIVSARVSDGKKEILICASSGKSVRFSEEDCRPQGRVSQGVKGITLEESEKVIGMEIISAGVEILSVSENGYGKRSEAEEFRTQSRGGKGIFAMKITEKTGSIVQIKPVTDKDDLVVMTNTGQAIRIKISQISLQGRNTQGVRLISLKEGEKVVAVEKILEDKLEEKIEDKET